MAMLTASVRALCRLSRPLERAAPLGEPLCVARGMCVAFSSVAAPEEGTRPPAAKAKPHGRKSAPLLPVGGPAASRAC